MRACVQRRCDCTTVLDCRLSHLRKHANMSATCKASQLAAYSAVQCAACSMQQEASMCSDVSRAMRMAPQSGTNSQSTVSAISKVR